MVNVSNFIGGLGKKDLKMIKNSTGSWDCFTSVSLDKRIADQFGEFKYVIKLD